MPSQDLANHFAAERDRHLDGAKRHLAEVIRDAQDALANLEGESPFVRSTVGGSVLNEQRWLDAERSLVRFWDAAAAAAIAKVEEGR